MKKYKKIPKDALRYGTTNIYATRNGNVYVKFKKYYRLVEPTKRILKTNDYLRVKHKEKWLYTHRIIGELFIPNPNNLPQINHKDEIKYHNSVDNLEWCSAIYNCNYGTRNWKIAYLRSGINNNKSVCIKVHDIEDDRNYLFWGYRSVAKYYKTDHTVIARAMKNNRIPKKLKNVVSSLEYYERT